MVKQDRYHGVDRYLPHAVCATASIVLIPTALVVALLLWLDGRSGPLFAGLVGAAVALLVAGVGSILWSRSAGSLDLAFSELLIWGWIKRKRAEERAARDARLLGLDDRGRPAARARSARDQQLAILGDLSSALESKDPYTHGHSQRVERHALRIARQLGLTVEEVADLRRAAALHDVGKIRVPHRILRKPGSLTAQERRVIEQHSVVGAWLVSNVCRADVVAAVRHHHERWDGRGYPDGLARDRIPLYARIIAVADSFDAMTSTRPYRVAYEGRTAIEILEAEAGAQFDPTVVQAFVEAAPDRVPIAALAPFLGEGLTRKLAGGLRRALSGTALTGAAAGTAALMVASVLSPVDTPSAQTRRPQASGPRVSDPSPEPLVESAGEDGVSKPKTRSRRDADRGSPANEIVAASGNQGGGGGARTAVLGDRVTRDEVPDAIATRPDRRKPKHHPKPVEDRKGPNPPDSAGEPAEGGAEDDRPGPDGDGDAGGSKEPKDPKKPKPTKPSESSGDDHHGDEEGHDDDEGPGHNGHGKGHDKAIGKGHEKHGDP